MNARVTIIGGGPAGIATALTLLQQGLSVLLVERSLYDEPRVGEHLAPNARPLLVRLDLLDTVKAGGHHGCTGVRSAWGDAALLETNYLFNPYGEGWILSRPGFDATLAEAAQQRGAIVLTGTQLQGAVRDNSGWKIMLRSAAGTSTLRTNFLVDASGRAAAVARRLGSMPVAFDRLVGIVCFLEPLTANVRGPEQILIEAAPEGWWYSAPVQNGALIVTYMSDADLVANAPGSPLDCWQAHLAQSHWTRQRTQGYHAAQEAHVRSARSQWLPNAAGKGWLATGDAVMSFDPLSGTGILKGLQWGMRSAEYIAAYLNGELHTLNQYQVDVNQTFDDYLLTYAQYYQQERRWPESVFWHRRQLAPKRKPPPDNE